MNIQEKLYKEITPLYAKLEKELPQMQYECMGENDDLTTFKAQCGEKYPVETNTGIVFYGRSNNGWNPDSPLTMKDLPNFMIGREPWPFFDLIRIISEYFYPEDWNNSVIWSNVCKVVPCSANNPPTSLWHKQYQYMVEILRMELEILSPKVVVFITGNTAGEHWDAPLFHENDLQNYKVCDNIWLKAEDNKKNYRDCTATLYKKEGRLYIITDRPEYRPIEPHADSIIGLIEKYK